MAQDGGQGETGGKARHSILHASSWIRGNGMGVKRVGLRSILGAKWVVVGLCTMYGVVLVFFFLVFFSYRFSLGVLHAWDVEEGKGDRLGA